MPALALAAALHVALLATDPAGTETELYFVEPGAPLPAPAARFEHAPYASVQAAVVSGTRTVVAVADRAPGSDRSFGSSLVRLEPGRAPVWLCDRVAMASTPLVAGGRVVVARGRAGAERGDGGYRIDDLTVDEIDLATGAARTLHAMRGYLLYVAGAYGDEVVIYRVRPYDADIVAVGRDGATRLLVAGIPAFARDFTIEGGVLRWDDQGARELTLGAAKTAAPVGPTLFLRRPPGAFPEPYLGDRPLPWPAGKRVSLAGIVP
jgi:hypothetical protein